MNSKEEDILRTNLVFVVKNLKHVDDVVDHLVGQRIVNASYIDRTGKLTRDAKVRELLDFLPCRKLGFTAFINALNECEHEDIAERLSGNKNVDKGDERQKQAVASNSTPSREGISKVPPEPFDEKGSLMISPASRMYDPSDDAYSMTKNPRGLALIFNNTKFTRTTETGPLSERNGSEMDACILEQLFRGLHFRNQAVYDRSAAEIKSAVDHYSQDALHDNSDCVIVTIMSHGIEGYVYGADSELVHIKDDIIAPFLKCGKLKGKPKLFIIQACRKATGSGQSIAADSAPVDVSKDDKDVLIGRSSVSGAESWRNTNSGTFFIQTLARVFAKHAHEKHAADLLTLVNDYVCKMNTPKGNAAAAPSETTLRKPLYFYPGDTK